MPIALINIGGDDEPLSLMYSLSHQLERGSIGDGWRGEHVHKNVPGVPPVAYVLRPDRGPGKPPSLWIVGQQMYIKGIISNQGRHDALKGWTAGFLQTIHGSRRVARYADGAVRELRLNTDGGPLKDGDEDTIFYVDTEKRDFGESVKVQLLDTPNFEMPLRYGPKESRLVATEGSDAFSSHLVLVHGKTIIDLAQLKWTVHWQGQVTWTREDEAAGIVWAPAAQGAFIDVAVTQNADLFADLDTNHRHTPFSLDLNEAENYCEIQTATGWQRCNMAGNTAKGRNAAPSSWRHA